MSALLPLAKAYRTLADTLHGEAVDAGTATDHGRLLVRLSRAHREASEKLRQQARAETSGGGS